KNHADVLRVLDHYLTYQRRQHQVASATPRTAPTGFERYVPIWTGTGAQYVVLDYPTPNAYHDRAAITLLRNAYEIYKQGDLLSDLVKHLRDRVEKAGADERAALHLAVGYLHWWNGDKGAALAEMALATAAVPGDVELRLDLADLRERHGSLEDALALADSI